jgi:hypothetical protein
MSTIPGHGHVLPPEAHVNWCAHPPSGLSGGRGQSWPHQEATSGYPASRGDLPRQGDVKSSGDLPTRSGVTSGGDFPSSLCHNVPMMGPWPQGTPVASPERGPVPPREQRGCSEEHQMTEGSSFPARRRDGMIAWQQEGLEPAPLMPESQLAEQELRPRVPASQLTPGHY